MSESYIPRPRRVLVTGGATGIGRAIASRFAAAGDTVVIASRRARKLRETAEAIAGETKGSIGWFKCNVTEPSEIDSLFAHIRRTMGALDVLVNCAGVRRDEPRSDAGLTEVLDHAMSIILTNLIGVHLITHAAIPLLKSPGGRIVNVSSVAAVRPGSPAYSASKSGVNALTMAFASRLGPSGVTVNAVAPGFVPETQFFENRFPSSRRAAVVADTPTRSVGSPEQVAASVFFLASDDASYITGEVLNVSGGLAMGR